MTEGESGELPPRWEVKGGNRKNKVGGGKAVLQMAERRALLFEGG